MTAAEQVDTTSMLLTVEQMRDHAIIQARVVSVDAKVVAERALVGVPLTVTYRGKHLLPHMALKSGLLIRVGIPLALAEQHLDKIADGHEPYDEPGIRFTTETVRPMAEPCVRVPLSLLRQLRGQEVISESSRRALVFSWTEDRQTGR